MYRISILCTWVLIAVFITLTESSDPSPLLDKSQMLSLIYQVSRVIRASCHNIMKCMIWHENNQYLYIYIYLQRFMPEVLFINRGGVNERPNESPRCEWRCAIAPLIFLKAPPLFVRFVGGGFKWTYHDGTKRSICGRVLTFYSLTAWNTVRSLKALLVFYWPVFNFYNLLELFISRKRERDDL